MIPKPNRQAKRHLRHRRVRAKVCGTLVRPRLSVFCSNRYLYAQLIDDVAGRTLISVNDLPIKTTKSAKVRSGAAPGTLPSAKVLGGDLAARAGSKNIKLVVFDRGGYRYTGRIKAFAEAARLGGLVF